MRDFKGGMKRQRGRNRKPGGGGQGGGGGNTNPNRAWDSTGPENVKVRGNAQHVYERYQQLARDASSSGDRVLAENFLQHAEHYFRVLRTLQPTRPVSEIAARDAFASGFDLDFEDESGDQAVEMDGVAEAGETEGGDQQSAQEQPRQERRDDRRERRDDRREPREQREPREPREQREPREPRGEAREDRGERRFGEGEPREGGRREGRRERYERRRDERPRGEGEAREPMPVIEPQGAPAPAGETAPQPRTEEHLPAFLRQPTPAPAAAAGEEPAAEERPRRTRRKRPASFDQGEGASAPASADEEA